MKRCPACRLHYPLLVEGSDVCIRCDARLYPDPLVNLTTQTTRRTIVGHAA